MKIIFLDIDGVLNSEDYAIYRVYGNNLDEDEFFDKRAITLINFLISNTDANVVITSTWRHNLEKLKQRMCNNGFNGNIIGETPYLPDKSRSDEIRSWIDDYECYNDNLECFVIIDDSNIDDEFKDNFVKCNNLCGFTSIELYKCMKILNK